MTPLDRKRLEELFARAVQAIQVYAVLPLDGPNKRAAWATYRRAREAFHKVVDEIATRPPPDPPAPRLVYAAPPVPPKPKPAPRPAPAPDRLLAPPTVVVKLKGVDPMRDLLSAADTIAQFGMRDANPNAPIQIPAKHLRVLGVALATVRAANKK